MIIIANFMLNLLSFIYNSMKSIGLQLPPICMIFIMYVLFFYYFVCLFCVIFLCSFVLISETFNDI